MKITFCGAFILSLIAVSQGLKVLGEWRIETKCYLPPQSGNCVAYLPRYYYNKDTRSCEPFVFSGCGGNANSFATTEECEKTCKINWGTGKVAQRSAYAPYPSGAGMPWRWPPVPIAPAVNSYWQNSPAPGNNFDSYPTGYLPIPWPMLCAIYPDFCGPDPTGPTFG